MSKPKDSKEDSLPNPSLFAGTEFFAILKAHKQLIFLAGMNRDPVMMLNALQSYYAETQPFMKPSSRAALKPKMDKLKVRCNNYMFYRQRSHSSMEPMLNGIVNDIYSFLEELNLSISHLNLKTSMGGNGTFNASSLFST